MEQHEQESILADLKLRKSRFKAVYTRYTDIFLDLCDEDETSKEQFRENLDRVEKALDDLTSCVQEIIEFCKKQERTQELKAAIHELELIETKYEDTIKSYQDQKSDRSVKSSISHQTEHEMTNPGKDMYKQLQRVSIPSFSGDTNKYESWKAAFMACVDIAPATPEYKLLQLRQCLRGPALQAIEDLGHSESAYEAAKKRLERKYGGERRKANRFLEKSDRFPIIKQENSKSIEQFADLLDIAVINLKDGYKTEDFESNYVYQQLLKKLPENMIARFVRWVYEGKKSETIELLNEWILMESEFKTIAKETKYGLGLDKPREHKEKCFFANENRYPARKQMCKVCNYQHAIWDCQAFKGMSVKQRWEKANELGLCFRCLRDNHRGSECKSTRRCDIDGCTKTHNRMLHENKTLNVDANTFQPSQNMNSDTRTFATTSRDSSFIVLRTIPVIVRAHGREIKINALLDDGSTKTYINEHIASELGLEGIKKHVNVNVINGKVETIETMNVEFELSSVKKDFEMKIEANTTKAVTGRLKPIDWNEFSYKWSHLSDIKFPKVSKKDKVDLLIGSDHSHLHRALAEVAGKQGEPIARLTPLGWTCIGDIDGKREETSLFTFHAAGDTLSMDLKKFWEIERIEIESDMSPQDKLVTETLKGSIEYSENRYRVGIPWKEKKEQLADNYSSAVKRLENTEKKLKKE